MAEEDRLRDDEGGTRAAAGARASGITGAAQPRAAVAEEQVVYRAEPERGVHGVARPSFDLAATLGGLLAALGALVLLSAALSAIVGTGAETGADDTALTVGAAVGGLIVLFLALLAGGWVAGRMARHHGARHGLMTGVWMVLLMAVLVALGAVIGDRLDIFDRLGLSELIGGDDRSTIAVATGLLALGVMLLGGWLGGRLGGRHRFASDVEVVETRRGAATEPGGILGKERQR